MPQNISMSISTGPMRLALALERGRQHRLLYLIRNTQPALHWYILLFFPKLPVYRHTEGHLARSPGRTLAMQAKGQVRAYLTCGKNLRNTGKQEQIASKRLI